MPVIEIAPRSAAPVGSDRWLPFAKNVHSQGGEDGIIAEVLRIMGAANRWCVEFGAWDGLYLSNTCNLLRHHGWSGVMIEGDGEKARMIRENHPDAQRVHAINTFIGFERGVDTLDDALRQTPIPRDFDLASIDVDGVDWYVWESMIDYRPRLVVIEFNPLSADTVQRIRRWLSRAGGELGGRTRSSRPCGSAEPRD